MRLIQHIKASNLLSFGPDGLDLELHDLNVLIGANGSGKSNFLEIFELLRALPKGEEDSNNIEQMFSRSGGKSQWGWKGRQNRESEVISLEAIVEDAGEFKFEHKFSLDLRDYPYPFEIYGESVKSLHAKGGETVSHFEKNTLKDARTSSMVDVNGVSRHHGSILSYPHDNYPIRVLANQYERIRLYREWSFGRNTIFRTPQPADQRNDRLEPDFSNLGMFLSRLRKDPPTKRALVAALQELYEGITDFEVITEGGTVQIFFTEGDFSIPAKRLSDGTLRYLCLIALLLDPTPPPLICIEEPELGLHPDIMPQIADLLVDASKRTQLIVTTHSDVLIDALSDRPESVLVCEKHEGQTQIKRLNREDLAHWLTDYSLGQLWMRGEIGGKRW